MATAASMYDLLLGKLVVNKVELSQVRFGHARKTPGTVLPQTAKEPQPFDPNRYKIDAGDVAALEKYVKDTKQLKEQLEKLRNWLPKGKSAGTDQGGTAADGSQPAARWPRRSLRRSSRST